MAIYFKTGVNPIKYFDENDIKVDVIMIKFSLATSTLV